MPRHDSCPSLRAEPRRGKAPVWWSGSKVRAIKKKWRQNLLSAKSPRSTQEKNVAELRVIYFVGAPTKCEYVGAVSGGVEVQVR